MNFKEWLLAEMGDIANQDVSHIQLVRTDKGYAYYFEHNGRKYTVLMVDVKEPLPPQFEGKIKNRYEIAFGHASYLGQNSSLKYHLTGDAGASANVIYSQILLAIKKLFQIVPVEGIFFSAQEPVMQLIYRRFLKQYLRDFVQVDRYNYIRKDKVREILGNESQSTKELTYKGMIRTNRDQINLTKRNRETQQQQRTLRVAIAKLENQFVYKKGGEVGYLTKVGPKSIWLLYYTVHGFMYFEDISYNNVDITKRPSQEEVELFLKNLSQPRKIKNIQDFLGSEEAKPLLARMAERGYHLDAPVLTPKKNRIFEDD